MRRPATCTWGSPSPRVRQQGKTEVSPSGGRWWLHWITLGNRSSSHPLRNRLCIFTFQFKSHVIYPIDTPSTVLNLREGISRSTCITIQNWQLKRKISMGRRPVNVSPNINTYTTKPDKATVQYVERGTVLFDAVHMSHILHWTLRIPHEPNPIKTTSQDQHLYNLIRSASS